MTRSGSDIGHRQRKIWQINTHERTRKDTKPGPKHKAHTYNLSNNNTQ